MTAEKNKEETSSQTDKEINQFPNLIETIGKALPFGYAFLVFCGALYFHFYYNTFHIDIFRYLDISEIAVSFLPIIITIVILLGFIMCFFPIAIIIQEVLKYLFTKSKKRNWLSKTGKYIFDKKLLTVALCLICAIYIYLSYNILNKVPTPYPFKTSRDSWWVTFLILSALILLFTKELRFKIISILLIFITSVVHQSISNVKETMDKSHNTSYTIVTNDGEVINTNDSCYFVGRTQNYIFLYNSKDASYKDISLNQIKKISFKNNTGE